MKNNKLKQLILIGYVLTIVYISKLFINFMPKMPSGGEFYLWLIILVIGVMTIYTSNQFNKFAERLGALTILMISYFLLNFITGQLPYLGYNIESFIFDYLLIYLLPIVFIFVLESKIKYRFTIYGFVLGITMFVSHIISGVLAYQVPLVGSIIYNSWYMIPSIVTLVIIVMVIEVKKFGK